MQHGMPSSVCPSSPWAPVSSAITSDLVKLEPAAENILEAYARRRRCAYASRFLTQPDLLTQPDRAGRTKAKVKARLLGDANPNEWDLSLRPKRMLQTTYERWEAKYD
jgi:hypothetical protein